MASADLIPEYTFNNATITLELKPLEAAAIWALVYHLGGKPGSLRTYADSVADAIAEAMGIPDMPQGDVFEMISDSVGTYEHATEETPGIQFNTINEVRVHDLLLTHLNKVDRERILAEIGLDDELG